ncbi:diiron oxygenase [Nocardia sp. CA2R105]|nr:diiron oxygenase [Nocardia coffeae]
MRPDVKFLFNECADENMHSLMFVNALESLGVRYYRLDRSMAFLGWLFRTFAWDEVAYGIVLVGEQMFDVMQRDWMIDDRVAEPIRRTSYVHVVEESRHMAFAREKLRERLFRASRLRRVLSMLVIAIGAHLIAKGLVNPALYREAELDWAAVRRDIDRNEHHRLMFRRAAEPLIVFLDKEGLLNSVTRLDVVASMVRGRVETVAGESITRIRVISRSAPGRPSFTASALHELAELGAVPVVDRGAELLPEPLRRLLSDRVADEIAGRTTVTLSFGNEVTACCPTGSGVRVLTATGRVFAADSVVCAMGFTAAVLDGVPMRPDGVVSNGGGRVVCPDSGVPVAGLYVVGWAKRGAKGGLGDNRRCAAETVDKIVADMTAEVSGR